MSPSIEEQLKTLAECGIRLNAGLDKVDLINEYGPEAYAKDPFRWLLIVLGSELEGRAFTYPSSDILHFDTECIEDHGDYARIALRLKGLAGVDLPIESVEDYVDVEEEQAWLGFTLNGKPHKWNFKVEDDWVDVSIFEKIDKLLRAGRSGKRLTFLDLGGQDCLIGCGTPPMLDKLRSATGLDFRWMVD